MKRYIALGLILLFLLVSCAPAGVVPTQAELKNTPTVLLPVTIETEAVDAASGTATPSGTIIPTIEFTASAPAECTVKSVVPEGSTLKENNIPDVSDSDWSYGTDNARITILAYCSYQRSACKTLVLALAQLQDKYKDILRVALRHFPQPDVDDKSLLAAQAAEAAGIQNRFWQMNSVLYTQQSTWSLLTVDEFRTWVTDQAVELGLSRSQFEADMAGELVNARINQMIEDAAPLQIIDTPVLFYNGILVKTGINLESLEVLIRYFLLSDQAYDSCPEMTIDPDKTYHAVFKTEKGEIVFELFPDQAPWAVNSFVFLAREGWYDNTDFFRVIPGLVVQGGDPSSSGLGGPGYIFSDEVDPSLRFDKAGVLAMTNPTPNQNGSQFFITYTALPELDGQYTIFGQVIEGMEVLNSLRPRNPETDEILLPADKLITVTIEEL